MSKIIEQIDGKHWRALDYFRILSSKKLSEERNTTTPQKPQVRNSFIK